jgi:hypothetical protein
MYQRGLVGRSGRGIASMVTNVRLAHARN